MIQAIWQMTRFEAFLSGYPDDGGRYELINGEVVEVRPRGDHEDVASQVIRAVDRAVDREIERLALNWFMPNTCCVKPASDLDAYVPDAIVLDRAQLVL